MPDDFHRSVGIKSTKAVEYMNLNVLKKETRIMRKPYEKYAETPVPQQTGENEKKIAIKRALCPAA